MNKALDTIQALRDEQLSWGLRAISIVGLMTLTVLVIRTFTMGWRPQMLLHFILYAVLLCITFMNRRLSYAFRATVLVSILFIVGVSGFMTWGLASRGLQALYAFCIVATMLFGPRAGIYSTISSMMVIVIFGFLVGSGILTFDYNPKAYLSSYMAWILALFTMIMSGGLIVIALGSMHRKIEALLISLQDRNQEMAKVIQKLEKEMTRRTQAEEEKNKLADRLDRTQRIESLGTLAGSVAHDLNNILVGSVSYPDMLLSQLPKDSLLRKPIETIKRSGMKAAAIVHDLMTLARRGVVSFKVTNLNDVIADYFTSLEFQKLKSFHPGLEVDVKMGKNLPNIKGSPIHLLKTVMNLVSNAAEAMPQGGKIIVSTKHEHIGKDEGTFEPIEEDDYVILNVSDSGEGISPDDIEKIFEPFYTKKQMGRSGTGLGMAVVWGTLKDHKGYIDVQSVEGKGTTFSLYFPVTEEELTGTQPDLRYENLFGRGEKILIVDDVEEQREIAMEMLKSLGYSVNVVTSGEEAISILKESDPDLLILDMYMDPGMDGLETYRQVLKIRPNQKAIIVSGYSETWRVKETQKLGAGSYLRKPYLLNDIAQSVRAELDRQMAA